MIRINFNITIITIVSVMFIVSGCGDDPFFTDPVLDDVALMDAEPAPDVLSDKGIDAIEVKTGEKFSISLSSNPTTGYSWQVEFDSAFVELIESEYITSSSDVVGAGGVETFVFLAHREGQIEIKLRYQRPWEDEPIEEQSRMVNITDTGISILNGTVGETITISLISDQAAGYKWHPEFDSKFLNLVEWRFMDTNPGSEGMETFEFLMLKQGETIVKMVYKHSQKDELLKEHVTLIKIHPSL